MSCHRLHQLFYKVLGEMHVAITAVHVCTMGQSFKARRQLPVSKQRVRHAPSIPPHTGTGQINFTTKPASCAMGLAHMTATFAEGERKKKWKRQSSYGEKTKLLGWPWLVVNDRKFSAETVFFSNTNQPAVLLHEPATKRTSQPNRLIDSAYNELSVYLYVNSLILVCSHD